jgi:hypothetical protein
MAVLRKIKRKFSCGLNHEVNRVFWGGFMSETEQKILWYNKQALLITWLLVFVPVGLFGLWKTSLFQMNIKIGIAVCVVILMLAGLFNTSNPIYPFVLWPISLYLLWKSNDVARSVTLRFAAAWVVIVIVFLVSAPLGGENDYIGGACSAVITEGNCTYFRDDNCNVIGKQCN